MISKSNFESKRSETKRSHCLTVVPRDVATRLIKYQRCRSVVFPPRPCTGHTSHRLRFAARHQIRFVGVFRCAGVRVFALALSSSYRIASLRSENRGNCLFFTCQRVRFSCPPTGRNRKFTCATLQLDECL